MKLSIVVPCYNEAKSLKTVAEKFAHAFRNVDFELVMVNNGSTDNSAQVFAELFASGKTFPFVKVVDVPLNQGYGYGILQGLKAASGDILGWTHADLQTDPGDVARAFMLMLNQKDPNKVLVQGRRLGRPLGDQFFTFAMQVLASVVLFADIKHINAQPKLFPRRFFETWQNPPFDFSLDLYAIYTAKRQGLKVKIIDVQFPPRPFGESKWAATLRGRFKMIWRSFKFIFELRFRPC